MMEILFNLDKYMFNFINGSGFVLLIVLSIFKILAKETTWGADDKIVSMLLGIINSKKGSIDK